MKTLNLPKAGRGRQTGFTIIELIVVILLLGILAATALPRFINVTSEAHAAAFDGVLGGFSTGMALGRAQWTANGAPTAAISNFGTGNARATTAGVIIGTANNALDIGDCKVIFDQVLQGGRPPLVADVTTTNAGAGALAVTSASATTQLGSNEWLTYADVANNECEYYYAGETGVGVGATPPGFILDTSTGEITIVTMGALT